jgi:hypothetical protein
MRLVSEYRLLNVPNNYKDSPSTTCISAANVICRSVTLSKVLIFFADLSSLVMNNHEIFNLFHCPDS